MGWWNRKPGEERARWVLEPLVGVGPLRFGMSPDQVKAALDGAIAVVSRGSGDCLSWQRYHDTGVTAIYGEGPRLVAVAVDAMSGPLVRLRDVELIARAPSEVRADIHELARREGASVRVNWSGDPEVAAWGVSMEAAQEWGLAAEGYVERRDGAITSALLVGPELAVRGIVGCTSARLGCAHPGCASARLPLSSGAARGSAPDGVRTRRERSMGDHEKPPPDPGQGNPPPGNADGQVPPPPPGDGKHKK
ncbi:hypothetical protein ABZW30_19905 [Kitasatospora sp. NPDC004669]|uniref:hypothetical protein n=1 Tax=Kitasatospora sp. NPDC004669 TaxID=3154555 RepID=UPI0033B4589C